MTDKVLIQSKKLYNIPSAKHAGENHFRGPIFITAGHCNIRKTFRNKYLQRNYYSCACTPPHVRLARASQF